MQPDASVQKSHNKLNTAPFSLCSNALCGNKTNPDGFRIEEEKTQLRVLKFPKVRNSYQF